MAIISFGLTTKEFLSGKKTVTRRDWKPRQTEMWQKFWDDGNLIHDAYDKSPRNGGKKIGEIQLTKCPWREQLKYMRIIDLIEEGDMCNTVEEFCKFIGKKPDDYVTVISFFPILEGLK